MAKTFSFGVAPSIGFTAPILFLQSETHVRSFGSVS